MQLTLNGTQTDVPDGITIADLIALNDANPAHTALMQNGEIVPSVHWKQTILCADDVIEMLVFVGGG